MKKKIYFPDDIKLKSQLKTMELNLKRFEKAMEEVTMGKFAK